MADGDSVNADRMQADAWVEAAAGMERAAALLAERRYGEFRELALDLEQRLAPAIERSEPPGADAVGELTMRAARVAAVMDHIAAVAGALRQTDPESAGRYGPAGEPGEESRGGAGPVRGRFRVEA